MAGYLGGKPSVRYLPSGTPVANARIAEGYRYTDRNDQTQEHTNWHSLVFYGNLADIVALYEKGDNIFVEGGGSDCANSHLRMVAPEPSTKFCRPIRTPDYQSQRHRRRLQPITDPQARQLSSIEEPGVPAEVEADVEVWPS